MIGLPQKRGNRRNFGWYKVEETGWAVRTGDRFTRSGVKEDENPHPKFRHPVTNTFIKPSTLLAQKVEKPIF